MPVHDWSRVGPGIFHDFHGSWITEIRNVLNGGLLPGDFYAISEQYAGDAIADVLALKAGETNGFGGHGERPGHPGATAVAVARPRVGVVETSEEESLLAKQRRVVIRHTSDDHIVALIEIVSPGNKSSQGAFDLFVHKAVRTLNEGWHLLVVDLQPRSPRDPAGIHVAIWQELGNTRSHRSPDDNPLTLASYESSFPKHAYVQPTAVGDALIDMPVFLAPGWYVNVPLEPTYEAAWRGVPRRWRDVLDPPGGL